MAGHSQFKNIMHRKAKQDAQRCKSFAKIAREIAVALKGGNNQSNIKLRIALDKAKNAGMPKENIAKLIKKYTESDNKENNENIRYEFTGSGGIMGIIECITDNKNRTGPEIKNALNKNGFILVNMGDISHFFDRYWTIEYQIQCTEEIILQIMDIDILDYIEEESSFTILCEFDKFNEVRTALNELYGDPKDMNLIWHSKDNITISQEAMEKLQKLITTLDENEDVQSVTLNIEF